MTLQVSYGKADGNTVPYPPLYDDVRNNHGFVDTRGQIDRVADIPEAQQSEALAFVLTTLAARDCLLNSLGCDLGQLDKPNSRIETRRWAGGYVQIAAAYLSVLEDEIDLLRRMAKAIENLLGKVVGVDRWEVRFILAPVLMEIEGKRHTMSAWVWFDAKASTFDLALASRERLLSAIGGAILNFVALKET